MPDLIVAVFGGGLVAGGVVEILNHLNQTPVTQKIHIKYIIVKTLSKPRDFNIPTDTIVTDDPELALTDPAINVYCELVGGISFGLRIFKSAIENEKHYVTANKAFLAETLQFVQKTRKNKACLFEGAVCGGIPILGLLRRGLCCDEISQIRGIVNGSTNFLLDRMTADCVDYAVALAETQSLGYLEADPSTDVVGHDARHKIVLLARLAFGVTVRDLQGIPTRGITEVTARDIQIAGRMQKVIKLIASARKGDTVEVFVWPCLVSKEGSLGKIGLAGNGVLVQGKFVGDQMFTGAGAGRFPTANSVVADLMEIARVGDGDYNCFARPEVRMNVSRDIQAVLYVRSGGFKPSVPCEQVEDGVYITKAETSLMQVVNDLPNAFVALVL
jgi:homoserine dehydrogenase